ncbi:MAG: hypothetical protein AAF548_02185 [Actinomycetota bacterium]
MAGHSSPGVKADAAALADPRLLVAVALLIANDHWWKAAHGNWLTGKLSDVVGLLVAAVLIRVALGGRALGDVGVLVLAGWFSAMKTIPAVSAATVAGADALLPWSNAVVTDPTDLIALPVLCAARPIVEHPVVWWNARSVRVLGLVLAATAAVATSESEDAETFTDLQVRDDGSIGWVTVDDERLVDVAIDACRPSDPTRCFRIVDGIAVEESIDGGGTWRTVWAIDDRAAPTMRSDLVSAGNAGGLRPQDLVVTDTAVAAAFVGLNPLVRSDAPGEWRPDPDDFREMIWLPVVMQGVAALLLATTFAAGVVRRLRKHGPGWDHMVVAGFSASLTVGITFAAMHLRVAWLPLELLAALPLLMLLAACGLALRYPVRLWRSLDHVGKALLGILLVAIAVLPPLPLVRWESSASPDYNAAVLASVAAAGALVILAPFIAFWRTRRSDFTIVVPSERGSPRAPAGS